MFRTATARATSYQAFEFAHALIAPLRWGAQGLKAQLDWPLNPFGRTLLGRNIAAGCELFETATRRYGKPEFGVVTTRVHGQPVAVREEVVLATPFCELRHFARDAATADPKVLLIAPLSGHYATLLRDTVVAMLPEHDLYVTDWTDARMVPADVGPFDLDDNIDTIIDFIRHIGPGAHVMAVCQPAVPALAAAALALDGLDGRIARRHGRTSRFGAPEASVSRNMLSPIASRPFSFTKRTSESVPIGWPSASDAK